MLWRDQKMEERLSLKSRSDRECTPEVSFRLKRVEAG